MDFLLRLLMLFAPFMLVGATVYGVNRTKANTPTSAGSNITDPGTLAGKVRCMVDTYTIIAGNVDGDLIHMGKSLPKGAYVLEAILSCNASVAATVTADVGDAEDPDRYMAAVDLSAAAINRIDEPDTGAGYKVDESVAATLDSQIIVRLNTMTTPVAGTIITLIIFYTYE